MDRHNRRLFALFIASVLLAGGGAGVLYAPEPPTPRSLCDKSKQRYARVGSYIARLTRRETFDGKRRPEEVMLLKVRDKPWSVYMKWIGEAGRGREGVYVKGQHSDKVHARLAAGDIPFVPAGRRMSVSPDSALMRSASTHPVTELGIGASIDKIDAVLADHRLGELAVVGPEQRDEFGGRAYGIEHRIPPAVDPAVPSGGKRTYWFDPGTDLPTVLVTQDGRGREVEYYHYDRLQLSVHLDDDDFDPDRLWAAGELFPRPVWYAVQKIREAAARMTCANKLEQIGPAVQNYSSSKSDKLPAACLRTPQNMNIICQLLPYLEQDAMYRAGTIL